MSKLPLWQTDWDDAEQQWEQQARQAALDRPLKGLKSLPQMVGITEETAKGLKWKSLKWMILKDHQQEVLKGFLQASPQIWMGRSSNRRFDKNPILASGDFFLYGVKSVAPI